MKPTAQNSLLKAICKLDFGEGIRSVTSTALGDLWSPQGKMNRSSSAVETTAQKSPRHRGPFHSLRAYAPRELLVLFLTN
jgi:hypothetical protein